MEFDVHSPRPGCLERGSERRARCLAAPGLRPVLEMAPRFFETAAEFRRWLEKRHGTEQELLVGFRRRGSGLPSMTWPESVDEALCFGWIDGLRKRIDEQSYTIRFTPRRGGSVWSSI